MTGDSNKGLLETTASLESFIEKSAIACGYTCSICGKALRDRTAARNHVEAVHIPTQGHNCHVCGKFLKTRNALVIHVSRVHNLGKKY